MKKFIIILLLILPLFLMVTISLAGRIYTLVSFVEPTGVIFREEDMIDGAIRLGLGEERQLHTEVLPENATNRALRFFSSDDEILSVDAEGTIKGLAYGLATVTAETQSGRKTATLTVRVTDSAVGGVTLSETEKVAAVGSSFTLVATVSPPTAENKRVFWSSSDPAVAEVGPNGEVRILTNATEPVTVTVRTEDGGYTADCVITVTAPRLAFKARLFENKDVMLTAENELTILDLLWCDGSFDTDTLVYELVSATNATLSDGKLLFSAPGYCKLAVTLPGEDGVRVELDIRYRPAST